MIRYMGHGLKLLQLARMRHPALPVPPSICWDHGSGLPNTAFHTLNVPVGSMRLAGLFVKVQGCLPIHPPPQDAENAQIHGKNLKIIFR